MGLRRCSKIFEATQDRKEIMAMHPHPDVLQRAALGLRGGAGITLGACGPYLQGKPCGRAEDWQLVGANKPP